MGLLEFHVRQTRLYVKKGVPRMHSLQLLHNLTAEVHRVAGPQEMEQESLAYAESWLATKRCAFGISPISAFLTASYLPNPTTGPATMKELPNP